MNAPNLNGENGYLIGTKYVNEAAQEWTSRKKITLSEPGYSQAIQDRHATRVKAPESKLS